MVLLFSDIDCGVGLRAMGIPKFYRWISERYPCLSQVIAQQQVVCVGGLTHWCLLISSAVSQIPDFDNLYLDMNGIIHTCTHPNDDDPHFRLSEEAMFGDIFHYIEVNTCGWCALFKTSVFRCYFALLSRRRCFLWQ